MINKSNLVFEDIVGFIFVRCCWWWRAACDAPEGTSSAQQGAVTPLMSPGAPVDPSGLPPMPLMTVLQPFELAASGTTAAGRGRAVDVGGQKSALQQ